MAGQDSPDRVSTTVVFSRDDVRIEHTGRFDRVDLEGCDTDQREDRHFQPQLPAKAVFILLPEDRAVDRVRITPLQRVVLPGRFTPLPILPDSVDSEPDGPTWDRYSYYPSEAATLVRAGSFRGYQMAKVLVYPMAYNAGSSSLILYPRLRVDLDLRPLRPIEERARMDVRRQVGRDGVFGEIRKGLRAQVSNPEDLERFYPRPSLPDLTEIEIDSLDVGERSSSPYGSFISEWPSEEGIGATVVIITNDRDVNGNDLTTSAGTMREVFQEYADRLAAHNLPTAVVSVEDIVTQYAASDPAYSIREFVQHAALEWGTWHVILGGDISVVPTRRLSQPFGPHGIGAYMRPDYPADVWYVRFTGADAETWNGDGDQWIGERLELQSGPFMDFNQVMLGRLPARNADEAAAIVHKIERYKGWVDPGGLPDDSWYLQGLVAAGPTNSADVGLESNGIVFAENRVVDELTAHPLYPWSITKLYPSLRGFRPENHPDCHCYDYFADYIDGVGPYTPWTGDLLRQKLNQGMHFVFHYEHSYRDRLGPPTMTNRPPTQQGCDEDDLGTCQGMVSDYLGAAADPIDINQVLALQNGADEARFGFVVSGGSWTAMQDMDAIGEAFIRAPNGGAVGYIGKTETAGALDGNFTRNLVNHLLFPVVTGNYYFGWAWNLAVEEIASGTTSQEIAVSVVNPLLGDPTLNAHVGYLTGLTVTSQPASITALGIQNVSITVLDSATQDPLEDAAVSLRQGRTLWARTVTSASGIASFRGVLIQDRGESLYVHVDYPTSLGKVITIPITASAGYLAYSSHEVDDCATRGNCDEVASSQETPDLRVRMKNLGSATTAAGTVTLRPLPPATVHLEINGEYRPSSIAIEKAGAYPPPESPSFRVPFSASGARVEGTPPVAYTLNERYRLWRDEATGVFSLAAVSPSASQDSVFTGYLASRARFTNVSSVTDGSDVVDVFADSIWFELHGDATTDVISFSTDAPDWITLSAPNASVPAVAPGDSVEVVFPMTVLKDMPDRENLAFTVTHTPNGGAVTRRHSGFVVTYARPLAELAAIDARWDSTACAGLAWVWRPVVTNVGSCTADSVILTLRQTAGLLTVADSTATFSQVAPGTYQSDDPFVLCAGSYADTAGFAWSIGLDILQREFIQDHDDEPSPGGGDCRTDLPVPNHLRADLEEGGVRLSWDPISGATRYWIAYHDPVTNSAHSLHVEGGCEGDGTAPCQTVYVVRSIEGAPLEGPGPAGYGDPYVFYVAGMRGFCLGTIAEVSPVVPWVRERPGWPKLLPEQSSCAPAVVDLEPYIPGAGKAILAATDRLYGWKADGTPLNPSGSSVLHDFGLSSTRTPDMMVSEAMAVGDWVPETSNKVEIALSIVGEQTHLLELGDLGSGCCDAAIRWSRPPATRLAPMLGHLIEGGTDAVLALTGTADRFIHGWRASSGSYYPAPGDTAWSYPGWDDSNYNTLAIGYSTSREQYELVASSRYGVLFGYPLEPDPGPPFPRSLVIELESGEGFQLSTPAIGDVDGDGDNDVVVTGAYREECTGGTCTPVEPGKIFVVDENTTEIVAQAQSFDWKFRALGGDRPPVGPSLADLDNDGDLEILVTDVSLRTLANNETEEMYPRECRLGVFFVNNGQLSGMWAADSIPVTARNDQIGGFGSIEPAVYPIGSPIVGDFDRTDSGCGKDIIVTYSNGAICAFEYTPVPWGQDTFTPKPGWPYLLSDIGREPTLAQLGGPEEGYSLVVQEISGWVHVLDLPLEGTPNCALDWASYGADGGNTRGKLSFGSQPRSGHEQFPGQVGLEILGSHPAQNDVRFRVFAPQSEAVRLELYDVAGRLTRRLLDGPVPGGTGEVLWDRRTDAGGRAPAGVYWCRIRGAGTESHRRLVVLK